MTKKRVFVLLAMIVALIWVTPVSAKVYSLEDLGNKIVAEDPTNTYGYVVGKHVFTSTYDGGIMAGDFMLGARSIGGTYGTLAEERAAMKIYRMSFNGTAWSVAAYNFTATPPLPTSFDIDYIDLKGVESITVASTGVVSKVADARDAATYISDLNTILGYTLNEEVTLVAGAIPNTFVAQGTIERESIFFNGTPEITGNPSIEKVAGYYFPFVLELPAGKTVDNYPNLKIDFRGKTITAADLAAGIAGEVFLLKVDTAGAFLTEVEVTIDLDGTGDLYSPTTYTIDLTELVFQATPSSAEIKSIAGGDDYADALEGFFNGYTTDEVTIGSDLKATGTVTYQNVPNFDGTPQTKMNEGYYLSFAIELPNGATVADFPDLVGKVGVIGSPFTAIAFDTDEGIAALVWLGSEAPYKTEVQVEIDLDGAGIEYSKTTYKIDTSDLVFVVESSATIKSLDESTFDFATILASVHGYLKTNDIAINNTSIAGIIGPQEIKNTNVFGLDDVSTAKSYLAFVIELNEDVKDYPNLSIQFGDKSYLKDNFYDIDNELVLIVDVENFAGPAFDITIDLDGTGLNYSPVKYTINIGGLTLADDSSSAEIKSIISGDDYANALEGFFTNYITDSVTIGSDLKATGTLTYQTVPNFDGSAGGAMRNQGYYLSFAIELPNGETVLDYPNVTGKVGVVGNPFTAAAFDTDEGIAAIVWLGDDPADFAETILVTIDLDGTGDTYAPITYRISTAGLTVAP